MSELDQESPVHEAPGEVVVVSSFVVNDEQVVSRSVDVVEADVEIELIADVVVLHGGTGQEAVGEIVVEP
jgi:hypothetical protein